MIALSYVRLSNQAKQKLVSLKRKTGLKQWNVLCRWALCLSLAETSKPSNRNIVSDSNVEMSWRTFTGPGNEELFIAILKARCLQDNLPIDDKSLARQFKLHLHRGIDYLATPGKIRCLPDILSLGTEHKVSPENLVRPNSS